MGGLLAGLTEEEHVTHRLYAQHHLSALFLCAPFIRRAQQKPLGYAGDYEMMNMLYRPSHMEGGSLFARVLNQCAATEIAARANINRIGYLTDKLKIALRAAESAGGGRVRVASIGSGPAREIEALLESEPQLGPFLDAMLVDQDARAISYCERKLTPIAARTGARLHFVRESVRRLLCGGLISQTMGQRQLIYSAGLFDYLSDRSFSALLGTLYDAIPKGGQLLIGNVDIGNPTRYFMEYFAEWFLIHRSRAQLLEKARLLRPAPQTARVESEPLGVNLFLVVEK
jgi:extracellular factor (EF) 3-hydroxypalmitic acid methyl ester biosynthesis protein